MTVINSKQRNWDYQYSNNNSDAESFAPSDSESSVQETIEDRRSQRKRVPLYDNFNYPRKNYGKKKLRRFNNAAGLHTLSEEEEFEDYVKLVEDYKSPFTRLMENETALKLWNSLIDLPETEQLSLFKCAEEQNLTRVELSDPFKRISSKIKRTMKVKKTLPLDLIKKLENDLISFFKMNADSVYISVPKTSFERLLLHAIAQYHSLSSISVLDDMNRHVEVYVNNECWIPVDECFCDIIQKLRQ